MEHEEAVILVVGGEKERESKALMADALAEARGASHRVRKTKAGARLFCSESSCGPLVIDTTALVAYNECFLGQSAAVWTSANSLRQMYDKAIYVVCVVTSTGPEDPVTRKREMLDTNSNTWLNVLSSIFDQHQLEIMVLVKLEETNSDSETTKSGIVDVLSRSGFSKNNISFVAFTREALRPTIKLVLETSTLYPAKDAKYKWARAKSARIAPFRVRKVTSGSKRIDWYGPWGPTPVILFGRTGSGKSTLAQMLTNGKLDLHSEYFAASSSVRGETTQLNTGQGRGWYVVDTPGFGEPDNSESTVTTDEAEKKLKRYVKWIQGRYCHFLYVVMKDRMDQLDVNLWKFFVLLFGDVISNYFTVVVSNADESWVEKNRVHLESNYEGCKSFVSAELPPIKTDDEEWEAELEEVRTKALCHLEEELVSLLRIPVTCDFGKYSTPRVEGAVAEVTLESHHSGQRSVVKAVRFVAEPALRSFVGIKRLMMMLQKEKKLLLLPH